MASLEELLNRLDGPREGLGRYQDELRGEIRDDVVEAVNEYRDHVTAIVRSNPGRSADEILSRADLRRTLRQNMEGVRRRSKQRITQAWNQGHDMAVEHVNSELDDTDAGFRQRRSRGDSPYLDDLLRDVDTNIDRLTDRLEQQVDEVFESTPAPPSYQERKGGAINVERQRALTRAFRIRNALTLAAASVANRVVAGGDVAASRGFTEAQLEGYQRLASQDPSARKMWVANFVLNWPCDMCWALHGQVIPVNQAFSPYDSFGRTPTRVYGDLMGPPRHPNCRCRLVILNDKVTEQEQLTAGMQRFGDLFRKLISEYGGKAVDKPKIVEELQTEYGLRRAEPNKLFKKLASEYGAKPIEERRGVRELFSAYGGRSEEENKFLRDLAAQYDIPPHIFQQLWGRRRQR